jgi:hypothetical protein
MIVIHGTYHWRPRRVAFRNDFCRTCNGQTVSVLIRTLDVLHIFWIPVLPLGVWSRWFCARCGGRPHHNVATRRGYKIAGAAVLAVMILGVWISVPPDTEGIEMIWALRFATPLALVFPLVSIFRHKPEPRLQELLAAVPPFEGWSCPICGGQLYGAPAHVCLTCGARHRPLAAGA